ncbi:MAG: transketolase [Candidatus Babeliales bacterium]|jgi:transketolase
MTQTQTTNRNTPRPTFEHLQEVARLCRLDIIEMLTHTQSSHLGSCFSLIDILVVLYHQVLNIELIQQQSPHRDYVILSKGHGAAALYATLGSVGLIERDMLLKKFHHGILAGHPMRSIRHGVEASTGSLGHGLSLGVGLARAAQDDQRLSRVYVIMGDGECQEGSNWEALTMASRFALNNLIVIIDANNLQALNRTQAIDPLPLEDKFKAFGCCTCAIDGHDYNALTQSINSCSTHTTPSVIIAHTVLGKGLSFAQDKLEWHYRSLKPDQYAQAQQELCI